MELRERIQIHRGNTDDEKCPFCPGEEIEHKWKTIKGERNNSTTLRNAMNKPSRCGFAQQRGAKPKDGKYPNQNQDTPRPSPNPIYKHSEYGSYGNQAHHCISGIEIMKGHSIEEILANEVGDYKGQTGYTINTAANGTYLPSYPKGYGGNEDEKYEIVKQAMIAGHGQTHIGGHTGHDNAAGQDYPFAIKEELTALKSRTLHQREECPFCVEDDGSPKKPFVPPYKLNQWLDILSADISKDVKAKVKDWPYFVSRYAKRYYLETVDLDDLLNDK